MDRSHSRPGSAASAIHLLIGVLAFGCSAPPSGPGPPIAAPSSELVRVYYPPGSCAGELEIELFDRLTASWRPHPEHPRLMPGACAWEQPDTLLNELRVRCVDPTGAWAPSDWVVGAEIAKGEARCPQ